MDLYTILLEDEGALDPRRFGDLVASTLGVTKAEARIHVRRSRGIFLEDLDDAASTRVVDALARDGVRARRVRNEELPLLPSPRRATWFLKTASGLKFKWGGEQGIQELPRDRIGVVSLGAIALPEWREKWESKSIGSLPAIRKLDLPPAEREIMRENLILQLNRPTGPAMTKKSDDVKSPFERIDAEHGRTLRIVADIIDIDRTMWLRVPMSESSYAIDETSLRFGDAWGFTYLVRDLVSSAGGTVTPMTLKLLGGADIKDLVFPVLEDFNRHTTWHAIRKALDAATSSPSPAPPAPSTGGGSSSASPASPTRSTSP